MNTPRGIDRLPEEIRELFFYKDGKLHMKCKVCPVTRSTAGVAKILRLIDANKFTGMCNKCDIENLARATLIKPEDVSKFNVNYDFKSQRREDKHIVIDKLCTECNSRVTVRVSGILTCLRRNGTPEGRCVRCSNPGWMLSSTGYIQQWLPNHPNNVGGYVPQHRYVMEQSLGRYLEKYETVHHIDGDRTNNDIDNLQLRQGNHGAGVRYECLDCGSHNVKNVALK